MNPINLLWICPVCFMLGAVVMAVLMAGFASWTVFEDRKEDKDD